MCIHKKEQVPVATQHSSQWRPYLCYRCYVWYNSSFHMIRCTALQVERSVHYNGTVVATAVPLPLRVNCKLSSNNVGDLTRGNHIYSASHLVSTSPSNPLAEDPRTVNLFYCFSTAQPDLMAQPHMFAGPGGFTEARKRREH